MKHTEGDKLLVETNQDDMIGFYQYEDKRSIYISIAKSGNYTWQVLKKDILEVTKL